VAADTDVEHLVARARVADADAWEALYRRAYPRLHRYARRRLATDDQADDAVSEAMARAIDRIDTFAWTGSAGGFDGWLFGILRNVVLETYRSGARLPLVDVDRLPEPPAGDEHDPAAGIVAREEVHEVRVAFARLSEDDREVLELRVVGRLDAEAVAVATGRRAGAVRMAQSRALARLRSLMHEEAR
jgi:RNA polymerase sigma-70 factor (ECF subfamily)